MSGHMLVVERVQQVPFTMVANSILETDRRLSWRAIGVYAFLVGRPRGWRLSMADMVKRHSEGRDAVYAALTELEEAGYIKRTVHGTLGRFVETMITVNACPSPYTENPDTEEPADAEIASLPFTRKPTLTRLINNIKNNREGALTPENDSNSEGDLIDNTATEKWMLENLARLWNEAAGKALAPGFPRIAVPHGGEPRLTADREAAAKALWKKSVLFRQRYRDVLEALPTMPNHCGVGKKWTNSINFFLTEAGFNSTLEDSEKRTQRKSITREDDKIGGFRNSGAVRIG